MKKTILTVLPAATLAVLNCFAATQYTKGDFTYSYVVGSGEAKVDKYSGSDSHVNIPSSFTIKVGTYSDGLDKFETFYITGISPGAFKNNKTITSVSWPSRLKTIDGSWAVEGYYRGGAFEGCTNLSDIPSLSGITTIGLSAFAGCAGLKSVEIPSSVTSLSMSAFLNCTGLKTAVVNYSGILPSGLFGGCTSLESLVLGDGIVGIEGEFRGYVTYAPYPLSNCNGLKSVSLGRGITVIPGSFIAGLSRLERVTSSGFIKIIGDGAFSGCTSIFEIPSLSAVTNIGQSAFYNCGSLLGTINLPRCKKIGKNAFRYCYGISKVELGDPLTEIGEYAFNSCASLHTVTFNGAPPTAYDNSFMDVKSGALGLYTTLYAHEWRERINADGTWHRLIMQPMYPIQPPTLSATQYHNQHPQGVQLTWSQVEGAPGYVVFRKIVGENVFKSIFATTATEYIDKVATMPNVKDFKAEYTVAVAVWNGNDRESIRYLSVQSKPALGCWRDNELGEPKIKAIVKEDSNPMLSGLNGVNVCTLEFNDTYDKNEYVFKQAKITGVHNGKHYVFTSPSRSVTIDIPAGEHGSWSFTGQAVFTEASSGKEYLTPIYKDGLENIRVCFKRIGRDGVKVRGVRVNGSSEAPNWFKYWFRDGALESLKDTRVHYDARPIWDFYFIHYADDDFYTMGWTSPHSGKVFIRDSALLLDGSSYIKNGNENVLLHTPNANALLRCAETVKHELGHSDLWYSRGRKHRGHSAWINQGKDKDGDGLSNTLEQGCTFLRFDYDNPDTFNFVTSDFTAYSKIQGDEEVYVRYLGTYSHNETYFDDVVNEDRDFSWESSDAPMTRNTAKLMAQSTPLRMSAETPTLLSGPLYDRDFFGEDDIASYGDIIDIHNINNVSGLSTNGSAYNGLSIEVSCSASTNVACVIAVVIEDENNEPVAWASRTGYVNEGENVLQLTVDGSILHDSGRNGYNISRISVFGSDGESMVPMGLSIVNYASPVRYRWSDFVTDNLTIQALTLSENGGCVNASAEIVVPNEDSVYDLSSYLCDAGTHGYVAEASQTNVVLHAGTNLVSLAFANNDIQMNAVSNAFAISKFTVKKDGEIVAAYNGDVTLNVVDETILMPTNAVLTFDAATVTNELVVAEDGALYSGINFTFDVVNSYTNAVDYSLTAYLNSTNSLTVDMATFDLSLTSGVNRIIIPFLGAKIRASEIDGPYLLSCVRLESKDNAIASQTLRMNSMTPECAAADFQGNVIETIDGVSRLQNRNNSIVVNVSFTTSSAVSGLVKASLVDANDNVVTFGYGEFAAEGAGTTKAAVAFAISNITASAYSMPLRVAYISIEPDDQLVAGLYDDSIELQISDIYYNYCVDATNGDDENTGDTFDAARKTLQSAVSDAEDGDMIFVKQGIYAPITSQNKAITIVSIDGNAVIDGYAETQCVNLGSDATQTNTVLIGFALRNGLSSMGGGAYGGTLKNCIIEGNKATNRGGGVCYSVLEDCQLKNNSARYGGGAYMSVLRRCLVSGNAATGSYGGGIEESTAYDCVIQGNSAATMGGGADYSELHNCTVVGNSAARYGGGVCDGVVVNSIVWGNTAAISNNHYRAQGVYNCTTPMLPGDGNIDSDPLLRGAEFGGFMLSAGSPCIDAGLDDGGEAECDYFGGTNIVVLAVSAIDFFGQERQQGVHVDMGAVEGVTNACLIMTRTIGHGSLDMSFELLEPHSSLTITADESIRPINHFEANDGRVFTGSQVQLDDITSDTFLTAYFKYYDFYVDAKNGDDENDGFSWATAKRTLQSAIDSAVGGEKIMVAKGMYEPIATADKAVIIESVSGASLTFINGGGTNRCANLLNESAGNYNVQTNTVLIGFTLMNGRATSGAGAYGGTLHDCVIKSNVAADSDYCYGGGTYYGVQYNCRYEGNSVSAAMYGYGGAAYYGTSYECIYANNSVCGPTNALGGATYYGTHYDCDINHNTASRSGGGAYGGTYYRTVISDNEATYGGGCRNASFYDGEIKNNVASSQGGGVYNGNVYRSVISKNTASGDGGGVYAANLTDCTIENNLSSGSGGGALLTNYTATRCTFLRNRARSNGGGVYGGTCNYCGITNNIATSYGGGAYNITGSHTAIASNRAASGGGIYNGTYNFCTLEANTSTGDGGGAYYGTFNDSLVFRNEAQGAGGGLYRSTFYRTRIIENTSYGDGGGVYNGTGYNSLIVRNKGLGNGGGTCSGYNYNCTITKNWCGGNGGGTSSGYHYNTIIVDNANPDGEYNRDGGSVYNCLSSNAGDPLFVNPGEGDYRLRVGSSCINAGNNSYANGSTDIALATRIQGGTIDIGAYEGGVEGFVIAVDSVGVGNLEYGSTLVTNGASFSISAQSQARAFLHFLTNGVVATTLPTLTLDSISSDVKVTAVFAHEMFVDGAAGDDGNDGLAWATAKKTIQAAIDDSADGDTIWVADGVYEPIVAKDRMIEIVSVDGPGETIIDGGGSSCCAWLGNEARYQFANDTRLSGFTLRNGYSSNGGGVKYGRVENCIIEGCHASNHGGGTDYSMVSNCVIRNNTAEDCGGGAVGRTWIRFIDSKFIGNVARTTGGAVHMYGNGIFSNCSFESNIAGSNGGALYNGIAYDSIFTGNRAAAGGATYNGTFYRCNLSENTSTGDGGGAYYGTFYDSTISNNYASGAGGGLYRSTYWRSRVMGNVSNGEGGGVYNGTGYSSLIARNKTIGGGSGGGTSSGYTYNCTVYGNYTGYYGGGSYNGYHYNSIIWGNENGSGANDTSGGSYYSCKTSNPMFVDAGANDFRLRVGSPCLNAGNSSYVQGSLDLLRNTRVQDGTIDIGACEGGVAGFVISIDSIGKGDLEYTSCVVAVGEDFSILASQGERPFLYFLTNGVVATTSSALTIVGVSDDLKVTAVFEHELFVDGVNGHDGNDGFSWATAKKTIQAAINVSLDGDTIWVADGVYDPIATSNRRIDVVSANGRGKTVIDGGNSARCVTLGSSTTHDASRISGFTIRNGYSSDGGGVRYGRVDDCVIENCRATNNGGGVNDTTISNCVVRNNTALNGGGASIYHRYRRMVDCIFFGNSAQNYGGGAYGGTARNCSFTGNVANSRGGGMSDCFAYNSTVSRNRSPSGGGVYEVIAYNSAIFNNTSTGDGGGAYYGTLYDSVISNNTSSASGGGLYRSTYWRCRVVGNTALSEGGGIYNGTGYSSLIAGNRTNGSGGGTSSGYTYNCTITENYNASSNGGGTYNGYHYNSLIWGNSNGYGHYNTQGGSYYSCKTSDPLFVNASEGDYRLRTGSPCINAGSSSYVQGSLDLARNTRVQDGTIDVGAYEGSVDGYVITIIAHGIENISHSASLVESNGTFTVYGVTGTRPFVGIYTNKVFASSTIPFFWAGICADGELTVEAAHDLFVDANEGNDANDGLSRGNAKQSIQAAIDISMSGDVIHVADGWYEPFSSGNMAIRIKSDNGPDNCVVYGDYLSRCATLGSQASDVDTVIEGLTLSCGYSSSGGGCCYGTAVDCIIEDCYSTGNGGGAYGTMLSGCSLVGNAANLSGGGSYGNKVIASSCIFEDNISYGDGGGAYNGAFYDCTFEGNRAYSNGGASYDATLQRCIIRNNQAANGGGTRYGTSYSSLYHDNYASSSGGGAYQGTLRNCTVTGNKAASSPAGVYNVTAYNTIVWGNYLNSGNRSEYSNGSYYYCCLNTTSTGTSTLASDPLFVDADGNDFRLSTNSPCLNCGSASYVSESIDLLGNARTQDGTVDLGCYEGAFSVVEETQTTPEPVPYSWLENYSDVLTSFGGDYEAMANAQSPGKDGSGKVWPNGSSYLVWQDYVAGTDPTDDKVFTAKIEMLPDGTPKVTWEPDTPELRATRTYTTYGKKTLLDSDWTPVTDANKDQYHFFKVEVKMK